MVGGLMGGMVVVMDSKGRVLIPSEVRKLLGLKRGSKLRVRVKEGRIILERPLPETKKIRAGRKWGSEAFLDAGEATFAD